LTDKGKQVAKRKTLARKQGVVVVGILVKKTWVRDEKSQAKITHGGTQTAVAQKHSQKTSLQGVLGISSKQVELRGWAEVGEGCQKIAWKENQTGGTGRGKRKTHKWDRIDPRELKHEEITKREKGGPRHKTALGGREKPQGPAKTWGWWGRNFSHYWMAQKFRGNEL